MLYSLEGNWEAQLEDGSVYRMVLPGTLDENGIGHRDVGSVQVHPDEGPGDGEKELDASAPIATRFTRKYTMEGPVRLTRKSSWKPAEGKRVFLEAERARVLSLKVNGKKVPDFTEPSLSTPHVFEVTGLLTGEDELELTADNSYPGLPYGDIIYSSAATDETQTNWNGILGFLRFREEDGIFLSALNVFPEKNGLQIRLEVSAGHAYKEKVTVTSPALEASVTEEICVPEGLSEIWLEEVRLADGVRLWDEYEGNLYELTAGLEGYGCKTVSFGIRRFADNGEGRLALNGRTIFLRSEANCCVFAQTGHPPMTVEEWEQVLGVYRSYGINCMRFHSYCPPEAAFTAADRMGMLMQPELSCWNPRDAFEQEESFAYYQRELKQVIRFLANHPSFVMLTLGNELHNQEKGQRRMAELVRQAHGLDKTRLYAIGSNAYYGARGCDEDSDFYASQKYFDMDLRGTFAGYADQPGIQGYINNQYPNAKTSYDATMRELRKQYKKPVFSFEVGQFEVLPDFGEIEKFTGVLEPANLELIRMKAEKQGLLENWKKYVEATGELSRIGYREEAEAAMRTKELSGISLLGLQDFPGQGTALVGMLNSHLEPKPFDFARPERFHAFFREQLPLVMLEKYTYEAGEKLTAPVRVANYGKKALSGPVCYALTGEGFSLKGELPCVECPCGSLTEAGTVEILLETVSRALRLDLRVRVGEAENTYPVWVYPSATPVCPENVYETKCFDEKARSVLKAGGRVYLAPDSTKEALPSSIQAQFTSDFWSVGTFPAQEGGMGQLIDNSHPIFREFPTEFHTNWQWWPMAVQRAVILPEPAQTIITEMDSYAYMRPMAQLLECRCGGGTLLFSSMGLQNLQQYPEARALLGAIYRYMGSEKFAPGQELEPEWIGRLFKAV